MSFFRTIPRAVKTIEQFLKIARKNEDQALLLGRLHSAEVRRRKAIDSLKDVEFKVFSQWGDDGIIQWLIANLDIEHQTFIEFGVEDYRESNTRFLLMNDNWSGLVMDGSEDNVRKIVDSEYYWKYDLMARQAFVDRENVNELIAAAAFHKEVGILHIDVDGNDYWIWDSVKVITPVIVIVEYNAVFGTERTITVPYDGGFIRTRAHPSCLYYGASIRAFDKLARSKGYAFVGCNSAGNNAYFVRQDKTNDVVKPVGIEQGFFTSKFRESRDAQGRLTYLNGDRRLQEIAGMPVVNVDTNQAEKV